MKVVLDTCVLYPVLTREVLMRFARAGKFEPLWSPRIFEEWAYRAAKDGAGEAVRARGDQVLMNAQFPKAMIRPSPELEARLWLPDPDDVHVLAAAVTGHADAILTFNATDFPRGTLREEGLERLTPDELLMPLFQADPKGARGLIASLMLGLDGAVDPRAVLKRAGLPRLAKIFTTGGTG